MAALAAGFLLFTAHPGTAKTACTISFVSPQAALEQGIGAYQAGYFSIALPALTCAAEDGLLQGQFHLARLYSDSASPNMDHRRAYELYRIIIEEHAATIDVDDDARAPYVGRALTAYAGYWLRGLPEIGLHANPEQAAFFLQQAATFFRNPDAQFELAKLYLKGEGVPPDRKKALHWLTTLTQEGHSGAQAFFAELLWRGKVVSGNQVQALALITVAVENAPANERIWVEEIYQSIYCGTPAGVRKRAEGLIAAYRRMYAPRDGAAQRSERPGMRLELTRTCSNGELVTIPPRETRSDGVDPAGVPGSGKVRRATDSVLTIHEIRRE